jgi:phosphoribosylformylglycinamidine synthase
VNLDNERRSAAFVRMLIESGEITAVHDISDGGLLVAIAEMALASGIGAELEQMTTAQAFGEDQARFVLAASPDFYASLVETPVAVRRIGRVAGKSLRIGSSSVDLAALRAAHQGFFPKLMGADAALA